MNVKRREFILILYDFDKNQVSTFTDVAHSLVLPIMDVLTRERFTVNFLCTTFMLKVLRLS